MLNLVRVKCGGMYWAGEGDTPMAKATAMVPKRPLGVKPRPRVGSERKIDGKNVCVSLSLPFPLTNIEWLLNNHENMQRNNLSTDSARARSNPGLLERWLTCVTHPEGTVHIVLIFLTVSTGTIKVQLTTSFKQKSTGHTPKRWVAGFPIDFYYALTCGKGTSLTFDKHTPPLQQKI